jgi:hypothetical protein
VCALHESPVSARVRNPPANQARLRCLHPPGIHTVDSLVHLRAQPGSGRLPFEVKADGLPSKAINSEVKPK